MERDSDLRRDRAKFDRQFVTQTSCSPAAMFRRGQARISQLRRLYSHTANSNGSHAILKGKHLVAYSAAATATILWYSSSTIVHNDATAIERVQKARDELSIGFGSGDGILHTVVWGSNK